MRDEIRLAPGLLIAMPQLRDPNFEHAVVLMVEHEDAGSFGLVLNRPTTVRVAELLRSIDMEWTGREDETAWLGGPVQPETGWVLHEPIEGLEALGTRELVPGLHLTSAPSALRELAKRPPRRIRFVMGYSGWEGGQLGRELTEAAWIHSDVDADFVFDLPAEGLWSAAIRRLGLDAGVIAPAHGVH